MEFGILDEQSWALDAFAADVLDPTKALDELADLNDVTGRPVARPLT